MNIRDRFFQNGNSVGPKRFVVGALRLKGTNQIVSSINNRRIEGQNSFGRLFVLRQNRVGNFVDSRIKSDTRESVGTFPARLEQFHKVTGHITPFTLVDKIREPSGHRRHFWLGENRRPVDHYRPPAGSRSPEAMGLKLWRVLAVSPRLAR